MRNSISPRWPEPIRARTIRSRGDQPFTSTVHTPMNPAHSRSFERPGIYRRRIRIRTAAGIARADLEDDPHRYAVIVRHDGERVSAIEGRTVRTPWTSCREATSVLDRLVGIPLSPNPLAVYASTNGREQCTHLFDLAGLAIAHAARRTRLRHYDVEVPCFNPRGRQTGRLSRDGIAVLEWTVDRTEIVAPRRAFYISGVRTYDLDRLAVAQATGHASGACYVFQPGVVERAARVMRSTLDFTDAPERLLGDLEAKA